MKADKSNNYAYNKEFQPFANKLRKEDKRKEKDLIEAGFRVLRFADDGVLNHIEDVTRNIEMVIEEISTPLIPRQRGRFQLPSAGGTQIGSL
ncbi:MAG: DUF559 domain-containing protein [bacterium]